MIYSTQEELSAGVAKWQGILGLRDWHIEARLLRKESINRECNACITVYQRKRAALIDVLDPIDYPGTNDARFTQDSERDLVHEMVHIYNTPHQPDADENPTSYDLWEQATECLARAFTALDRRTT